MYRERAAVVDRTIKLGPLVSKKKFARFAEQTDDVSYGMIGYPFALDGLQSCYVCEFTSRKEALLIAFVDISGNVYAFNGEADKTGETPFPVQLVMKIRMNDSGAGGNVVAVNTDGSETPVARFSGTPHGDLCEIAFGDPTYNSENPCTYPEFMATMFVRYFVCSGRLDGAVDRAGKGVCSSAPQSSADISARYPLDQPVELFNGFDTLPLPDAIEAALFRVDASKRPSGIEKYARRVLTRIDLDALRAICSKTSVNLARISTTDSYFLNYDASDLKLAELIELAKIQTALNRINAVLMELGVGLAPLSDSPKEEYCSVLDMSQFYRVTAPAALALQALDGENPHADKGTVGYLPGATWDVLTRFAHAAERLNFIVRFEYTYEVNIEEHELRICFVAPNSELAPKAMYDRDSDDWVSLDASAREDFCDELTARMTLTLAAVAFGSGSFIDRCFVCIDGYETPRKQQRAYGFERAAFIAQCMPVAQRAVGEPFSGMLCKRTVDQFAVDRYVGSVLPEAWSVPPKDDERVLVERMRTLLLADSARELEVMEPSDDPYKMRFDKLYHLAETDPKTSAEGLAELIEELEAACVAEELSADGPVELQYCDNYAGRVLLPLLIENKSTRIIRVPDALYLAHRQLASMYYGVGDFDRALDEARQCYDMAKSAMTSHVGLLNILAELERWDELIDVAKHALRITFDSDAVGYFLYRAAFAYWNLDRRELALACYRLVPRSSDMRGQADEEMRELMSGMTVDVEPSLMEAVRILQGDGIELPITSAVKNQLFDAAILFSEEHFNYLAVRCFAALQKITVDDDWNACRQALE